jgi:hypothetical protein
MRLIKSVQELLSYHLQLLLTSVEVSFVHFGLPIELISRERFSFTISGADIPSSVELSPLASLESMTYFSPFT